jgi:predicted Zn-dependent protease
MTAKKKVDHCHKTGQVRGILCNICNLGIGLLNDSVEIIESALNYLKNSGNSK